MELCDFDKRAYDSQTGRFNQTDILADQRNNLSPYNYCSNNPINRTDPTGMIDGWYNNENNQSTFDKNINSQADMTKAGINGTFIGKEALVVDNKDNTMKWGNKDGTLSGINLPEVAVSAERNSNELSYGNNNKDWLKTTADVFSALGIAGAVQTELMDYGVRDYAGINRQSLSKLSNYTKTANEVRAIGAAGTKLLRFSKALGYFGAGVGTVSAGVQVYNNPTAGNATRLTIQGAAIGSAFIPVVGWSISLGIGAADLIWGDEFYQWIDKR